MVPKRLSATVSAGGQISPEDVGLIAELGFRSIICHRPDGEAHGQTTFDEIAAACSAHNIVAKYQPVSQGEVSLADAQLFGQIIDDCAKPIFAYCRSGRRCSELWQLLQDDPSFVREKASKARVAARA